VVELADGSDVHGVATGLEAGGELVITGADGAETTVSAGDVVHLRGT
jgi:uncharacterized protein YjlB